MKDGDSTPRARNHQGELRRERARLRAFFRERDAKEDTTKRYHRDHPAVRLEAELIDRNLRDWPLAMPGAAVLEIGCGTGAWLPRLIALSPRLLVGVDLLASRLQAARARFPEWPQGPDGAQNSRPHHLLAACASDLPFAGDCFDLVVLATVTSGIRNPVLRDRLVAETRRVLRPGGRILHYDLRRSDPRGAHWDPLSPEAAAELFQMSLLRKTTLGLLPPLARALGPLAPGFGSTLAKFRTLHSHGLALLAEDAS